MKIQDAKKAYAAQMDTLWTRKRALSQALKNCQQGGAPNVDRVEISRELSAVDAQYNEAQGVMESIIERETVIHNAEVAKQQGNALSKAAKEMGKMLEIYRRIASGGQVPPEDEQRLMEYNHELYMAAKTAAMLQEGDGEKYDSLFEDEEEKNGEEKTRATTSKQELPRPSSKKMKTCWKTISGRSICQSISDRKKPRRF